MVRILLAILLFISTPAWAVTQWNDAVPAVGDSKSAWPGQVHSQWSILETLLSNYIRGEKLTYKNSTTITVSSGEVVVANSGASLRLFLQDSGNTDITTANLDSGSSFSAGTTYYVYAATSSATASSSTYYISLSSSAPAGPTYYTKIGTFTTDSSANVAAVHSTGQIGFGVSVPVTFGVINQAATDGILSGYASISPNGNIACISDSNPSPTTIITQGASGGSGGFNGTVNCSAPITKGDYYKITTTGGSAVATFKPVGQ